jgi:hypothetical protein
LKLRRKETATGTSIKSASRNSKDTKPKSPFTINPIILFTQESEQSEILPKDKRSPKTANAAPAKIIFLFAVIFDFTAEIFTLTARLKVLAIY